MNTYFSEYSLISSLQNQFKTNNIIFDIIFGMILGKLIQYIINYSFFDIIKYIYNFRNYDFFNRGKVIIICSSNKEDKKYNILLTIDYIIKQNLRTRNNINNIYYDNNDEELILRGLDKTLLCDDIYVTIDSENIDKKKDESVVSRLTIYNITLTSKKYNPIEINNKMDELIEKWKKNISIKPPQITYDWATSTDFKSFKTFDNLFFDGKDNLIKVLNRFKNNEEFYKKLGRPYTLGILLYGEPGCGKTSVLKAISNYMKLDIHSINIKTFEDTDSFLECWYQSLKTNTYSPNSLCEKIIHLPEIDYLCSEFLKDKEKKDNDDNNDDVDNDEENEKKNIVINLHDSKKDKEEKKLSGFNKSFFRELFDGVNEQHGRIIVMDSNNPDKLDPIMIRDGRIDIKLRFDKMSSDNMKLYLEHIYSTKLSDNIILPNRKFRVAKIQSICETCLNDNMSITDCIDIINNTNPDTIDLL
jgi:SpoVK/Ycf46/Vps4 family AAA+-type ATPase